MSILAMDPVLRHLPSDRPPVFDSLAPDERAWRGRGYLICWAAGYPEPMAWWLAMSPIADVGWLRDEVRKAGDAAIEMMVEARLWYDRSRVLGTLEG